MGQTSRELFDAGRLNDAIEALGAELRNNPSDQQRRIFLFELLSFAGNWDRADKQLDILAGQDKDKRLGALLYRAALNAERTRHEMFLKLAAGGAAAPTPGGGAAAGSGQVPTPGGGAVAGSGQVPTPGSGADGESAGAASAGAPVGGTLNGREFESIEDSDPRIGARLEVLAADSYMWIPLAHIALIEMQKPKRLRDLLWAPAIIHTGPAFQGNDLGEVLLPVLSPFSWKHADEAVRLGRKTVWEEDSGGGEIPFGQKMLLVDGEEVPLLEVRKLEFRQPAAG
jgi:type VI secretion system protein ImpE